MNCDVHGHILRSSCNLPVLYSYCNSFFVHVLIREFGFINVHLFDILPEIWFGKVWDFFCFESGNQENKCSGFWCHRLEQPAYPHRICAVTRSFQTMTLDLSVFQFLPRHYHSD